ncbi:nucleotide-sugar transporter family protein [Striga asiatica]|uniref:Nucleotide-sugar transporter family protein n=1 Tax=Striga asiatica TaxID=4170 RepID=A0A5A7PQ01_STRAF|nr:nucleotide-sugar transporter family protein [Striga asiatica]
MSVLKSSGRFFTTGLVAAWYSSNIGVLLLNKYLLSNYGFKYPIFLTMCHMTACSLLSYVAIAWMKMVPMQTIRSRVQFMKISALSLIFCASVVSGNFSLKYLPVSFNQAIGATTPFFTAVFAYLMTLKREAWLTYLTLVPVVTGVIIASGGEPSFHLVGFIICVAATAARHSNQEKLNSMNLLLYMAPIAVVLLLPATIYMEENVVGITLALAREDSRIIWLLLFNSALAHFVNLTNFLVTKHTSALTLQVLGNAKGAVAVVISIMIFKNPVSATGMLGYSLTVFGVILYSEAKKLNRLPYSLTSDYEECVKSNLMDFGHCFPRKPDHRVEHITAEKTGRTHNLLIFWCGRSILIRKMSAMKSSGRFFTIGLVTAWYSSNIGVLLLNKYLLSNYGFKYPIFLTMCHMTACSLLSYVAIAWMKMVPMQTIRSRVQFMKISALSLIFCTSVVSGNISLKYLPVSFNQAIGATTPFFTAVFAYMMTLKREAWLTYLTLVPVVTGVIIASGGEPSFHLFGFIMCVGATAARALKSVVQGILLSSEGEKLNSMNLLLYMAPIAVVLLLPATIYMEENVLGITLALAREDSRIIWLLLFNSALAYFVNLTNFLVTKHTSALTLQVLGNAKGAVAVVISILIFKNPVSVTGMLGKPTSLSNMYQQKKPDEQSSSLSKGSNDFSSSQFGGSQRKVPFT